MKLERRITLEGEDHIVLISDEPEALLAAKAAGRAVVGVERPEADSRFMEGIFYVVPSVEAATDELAELVLRRHLGFPWMIGETRRLLIRELEKKDATVIPEEEYGESEMVFRSETLLEHYIRHQYRFYEYGTWGLMHKKTGTLLGIAGVSNPNLPEQMEALLRDWCRGTEERPWLELGYHIFRPFRNQGYAGEAVTAVADYSREVLGVRLCAMIHKNNQASRKVAEGLGLAVVTGTDIRSCEGYLLYAEPI